MCLIKAIFLLVTALSTSHGTEVLRPKGVSLIKASLYTPGQEFRCLDGSGSVPFRYINDDYCDCRDGSDEPGTSACPNGSFHCTNIGHSSIELRSSRVNDGVCDCCDGSDEWVGGRVDCSDVCYETGRAAREEVARREEENKKGYTLKLGLIEQGKNMKQERENRVTQIQHELAQAEAVKAEREEAKQVVEEPESAALEIYREEEEAQKAASESLAASDRETEGKEVFDSLDSDDDGEVTAHELRQDNTYDTNRDGEVSKEEAAEEIADMEPPTRASFPGYHGEDDDDPSDDYDSSERDPLDEEEEGDEDEDYDPSQEAQQSEEEEKQQIVYDPQTQALVDAANAARAFYQESVDQVKMLTKDLTHEEDSLNQDYGPDQEYRSLEAQCFEFTDRQYTYKLCPFNKATQSQKGGGGETRLGGWGEWVTQEGAAPYTAMKYSNGQGCWNGPNRSTLVLLQCGVDNALLSATEPSKCEYVFTFTTPAACQQVAGEAQASTTEQTEQHTEL